MGNTKSDELMINSKVIEDLFKASWKLIATVNIGFHNKACPTGGLIFGKHFIQLVILFTSLIGKMM